VFLCACCVRQSSVLVCVGCAIVVGACVCVMRDSRLCEYLCHVRRSSVYVCACGVR